MYNINSADNPKFRTALPHQRRTTVSVENIDPALFSEIAD